MKDPRNPSGPPALEGSYRVGEVEIDAEGAVVRRDGEELHLRDQSFQVLLCLLEAQGRVVAHRELIDRVWGRVAVGRDSLVQCVADIRRVLGDDPRRPTFIRTVPRRGYQLVAAVEEIGPATAPDLVATETITTVLTVEEELVEEDGLTRSVPALSSASGASRRMRWWVAAALVALAMAATAVVHRTTRSPPLPLAADRTSVLVVPFRNLSGEVDLAWLERAAPEMLITGLARSEALSVPSLHQVDELLRSGEHSSPVSLDDALARAAAHRIDALVAGSFSVLGSTVRIDARIHDPTGGAVLAAERLVAARPEALLSAIDGLSTRLMARLGARMGEKLALAEGLTRDLEAYRLYSRALDAAHAYRTAEARALLEEALRRDPAFVLARARLGYLEAMVLWFPEEGIPHLEQAFRERERLTDRDRRLVVAWHALARSDFEPAITAYRDLLDRYPAEVEAYWRLGNLLRGEDRLEEAVTVLEEGLAVAERSPEILNVLGMVLADAGELERAIAAHRRYVALDPTEANAWDSLGMTLDRAGRYEEAIAAYDRALELEPDFDLAAWHRRVVRYRLGHRAELRRYLEERIRTLPADDPELPHGLDRLGWIQYRTGDREGLARTADALAAAPPLAEVGRTATVLAATRGMDLAVPDAAPAAHGRRSSRYLVPWARGLLALGAGRTEEGLRELRAMQRHRAPLGELWLDDELARALLGSGRYREAKEEVERLLALNPRYPAARYLLGAAALGLGERDVARQELEAFLAGWPEADPDLPEVVDAKNLLADLAGS